MRAFRNILVILIGAAAAYFVARSRGDRLRELAESVELTKRPLTLHREPVIDITEPEPQVQPAPERVVEPEPVVEVLPEPEVAVEALVEPEPEVEPEVEAEAVVEVEPEPEAARYEDDEPAPPAWIQPTQGECPLSHPIKARFATGRYHEPGTKSYDKVVADCCYPDVKDAEKDGFSRSRW